MTKIENFEIAFSESHSSCRGICDCGKEFYNRDGGWDWEPGELDALKASGAINMDHSVSYVGFEGNTYVTDCDCWKPRALKIMACIDGHSYKIANYLNAEKKRVTEHAAAMPTVNL